MKYQTSKHQSRLMDYLWMPHLISFKEEQIELTGAEKEAFADVLKDIADLQTMFQPFKDRIQQYFLVHSMNSFMETLYIEVLESGRDPQSFEDLSKLFKSLSEKSLQSVFFRWVSLEGNPVATEDQLLFTLDDWETTPENKWQIYWSYRNISQMLEEMLALYRDLLPLYQPYYEKYEPEVDQMIEDLDIEAIYQDSPLNVLKLIKDSQADRCKVFVWSSLNFINKLMVNNPQEEKVVYLSLFPRTEYFLKHRLDFNLELFDIVVKAISDPVRYQILKLLQAGDLMNKEIAQQLNITSANVSFHVQKLIHAQLVSFKEVVQGKAKYQLNRPLLKKVLEQIQHDFRL